jgi:HlyD family secretion protein
MKRRERSSSKWVILLLLLAAIGSGTVWWIRRGDDKPQYQTTAAKRADVRNAVTATGQLSAVVNVQVGSQISGNIQKLFADFNTPVKAGQIVAQLDPATFDAVVAQAKGELANARAALELAQLNSRRLQELAANKIAPQSDLDKAIADLHSAEAAVEIRTASLQKAQIDLSRCTVFSPVDGVVVSRNVDVGQTVAASMTAPVLFTIAGDLSEMHIEANVSEADIGGLREDMDATFTVDAFPDRTFHGKVVQVRYAPVTVDNVVTYVTVVEVKNEKKELRPGMTANVSILLAEKKNVVVVPNAALRFKPTQPGQAGAAGPGGSSGFGGGSGGEGRSRSSGGGGPSGRSRGGGDGEHGANVERKRNIYRLEGDVPKPLEVTTGVSDGAFTEVVSGLNEGESIITGVVITKPTSSAPTANPFGAPGGGGSSRRGGP